MKDQIRLLANTGFLLGLEKEVICHPIEGRDEYWQAREGNADGKNSLAKAERQKSREDYISSIERTDKKKYKFTWKCLAGHKGTKTKLER